MTKMKESAFLYVALSLNITQLKPFLQKIYQDLKA